MASGDLTGAQYRLVTFSGNDVFLPTSGVLCAGYLQNKPANNEHAAVISHGYSKVILAGSLGSGQELMAGNNGFATLAGSGQMVHGINHTSGNSGEIVDGMVVTYRKYV